MDASKQNENSAPIAWQIKLLEQFTKPILVLKQSANDFIIEDYNKVFVTQFPSLNDEFKNTSVFDVWKNLYQSKVHDAFKDCLKNGKVVTKTFFDEQKLPENWRHFILYPIQTGMLAVLFEKFNEFYDNQGCHILEKFFSHSSDGLFFGLLETPLDWKEIDNKPEVIDYLFEKVKITRVNRAMAQFFNISESGMIGATPRDFWERNPQYDKKIWGRLFENGWVKFDVHENFEATGLKWFETDLFCFYNEKNEIAGIIGIQKDITSQKLNEERLVQEKEKAERADKLKTTFLANLSHEVRSPMNAIVGFSEILSRKEITENERKEYHDIIQRKSYELLDLVDGIIDLAKLQSNQMQIRKEDFCVTHLMNELFGHFNQEIQRTGKDLELILDIKFPQNYCIRADYPRLKKVLHNLIDNAVKFTEKGNVTIGASLENKLAEFYIKDTGIGIPAERIPDIFNRFNKPDEKFNRLYSGTGLGLALSKGLIELMGGHIWVISEENQGTEFRFGIPVEVVVTKFVIKPKQVSENTSGLEWGKRLILVAEDEDVNYFLIQQALKESGAKLIRARNGVEAVEMAINQPVDAVLMDIRMPEMDGYEATRTILKKKKIPIIAQTAYAMPEEYDQCMEAGCSDYLAKPLTSRKILDAIKKAFQA